jgi:hypothetical protein
MATDLSKRKKPGKKYYKNKKNINKAINRLPCFVLYDSAAYANHAGT